MTILPPIATFSGRLAAQTSTTGNNVYTAWPNNDTGHRNVFVAMSSDDSKTIVLSRPNKEHLIYQNTSIAASVYVYVICWTNESWVLEPVIRASTDGGNTFCPMVMLNSTSTRSIFCINFRRFHLLKPMACSQE
ncbi:MAG: hypothetical protein DLM72_02880 [Candidatus Nitrosopolaris wilkensis]|nr:MAG: hypothetical protein DLM72_02880 [Candidatus Nitrosopolaris wilkensis]